MDGCWLMVVSRIIKGRVLNRVMSISRATVGGRTPRTGYHLVDPRPWPIIVRAGIINEAASFIRFVHNGSYTLINFICAT